MCYVNAESPAHIIIHCPFAQQCWNLILEVFCWATALSNNILIVGYPFLVARRLFGYLLALCEHCMVSFFNTSKGKKFSAKNQPSNTNPV